MSDDKSDVKSHEFRGAAIICWVKDGKMKYQMFDDQELFEAEVKRISETTPPRLMYCGIINWDNRTIDSYLSDVAAQVIKS